MQRRRLQVALLVVAVIVLLNIIFVKAALFPLYYEKEQFEKKNEHMAAEIENLKKVELAIEKEKRQLKNHDLETMIPAESQVPLLYEYIYKIADEADVFLREAYFPQTETVSEQVEPNENSIVLAISGGYSNIMVFLEKIETDQRLFLIKNISISKPYSNKKEETETTNNDLAEDAESNDVMEQNYAEQQEASEIRFDPGYNAELEINYYDLSDPELKK